MTISELVWDSLLLRTVFISTGSVIGDTGAIFLTARQTSREISDVHDVSVGM